MKPILLIARRELSAYLRTWLGYIVIAAVLAALGLFFNAFVLGRVEKSAKVLENFFYLASGFTIVACIFFSMRLLAEERQSGTLTLLYSSPVRDAEIVVGKFLSAFVFLALFLLVTVYMPALIFVNGKVSVGHILAGYLGLLLLGGATLAIGIFGSALTRSQVVAAILGATITVGLLVCWLLANVTERPLSDVFSALALWHQHFVPFQRGIVHLRDVVYYFLVIYVALFAATRVLEARRWK